MYDQTKDIQVSGFGTVVTGGVGSTIQVGWTEERTGLTFLEVPPGKKLVMTDFVFIPQTDCTTRHVINLTNSALAGILQLYVNPSFHTDAHFTTGYVLGQDDHVLAFSDAGSPSGQHVTIYLSGYLVNLHAARV
jgi:hypothetical protein